jgi:hypothetical protein
MVSILVLLCQGLLFENFENGDTVVFAFGILIILIVCFCICLTAYSMINSIVRPQHKTQLLLRRQSARKLPREMLLELYFINSLSKIDYEREIEMDMKELRSVMTLSEFEATRNAVKLIYKPLEMVSSERGKVSEIDANLLNSVLPKEPGGVVTPMMLSSFYQMISEFVNTVNHQH